ncbi:MAG: transporter substrate-binding domain-containing protein [Colwellia sp.]|nr:transporter substrate-binding domain-containing protein [Colwellia sp.]
MKITQYKIIFRCLFFLKHITLITIFWLFSPVISLADEKIKLATLKATPYVFGNERAPTGIAINLIEEVFKRMNIPYQITVYPWSRAINNLKTGEVDCVMPLLRTKNREVFTHYPTHPIIHENRSLFVLSDSSITINNLKELANYRIGMVQDYNNGDVIDKLVKDNVISNIEYTITSAQNIKKILAKNRFDILIEDKHVVWHHLKKMKKLKALKMIYDVQNTPSYIGCSNKKNLQWLLKKFDHFYPLMIKDGTYDMIIDKYR